MPSFTETRNLRGPDVGPDRQRARSHVEPRNRRSRCVHRANNGWRATVGTLKDASLEFEMVWDTVDTDFTAIRDAFLNNPHLSSP